MIIQQSIIIDKPAEECWEVLGVQFTDISKWASSIHKSSGMGESFNGSTYCERQCLNGKTIFHEKLVKFEKANHLLSYDIIQGRPAFVKYANNTWQLIDNGDKTKLEQILEIRTKGLLGSLLGSIMKLALTKQFKQMMEEFKYYVENGQAHERKVKF